jgi:hypothetical protein
LPQAVGVTWRCPDGVPFPEPKALAGVMHAPVLGVGAVPHVSGDCPALLHKGK